MASFQELKNRLKKVQKKTTLNKIIDEIVLSDKNLKYAKEDEFLHGNKPDGSPIGRYKSKSYEQYKLRRNPLAGGDVDLIDTGSFVDNMKPFKSNRVGHYIFKSSDKKSPMLQAKYGSEIMGLNQKTFENIQKNVYADKFMLEIKRITGL